MLTLAEQLWGSSEPFPDETLWITEEISSIKEVRGVQKFPSYPERFEVPRLGLTSYTSQERDPANYGPEGFRLRYEGCRSAIHVEEVVIYSGIGSNGTSFFEVTEESWKSLQSLAADPEVWSPPAFVYSWSRTTWSLEWWRPPVHRIMTTVVPPVGAFWRLYKAMLELAGLKFFCPARAISG